MVWIPLGVVAMLAKKEQTITVTATPLLRELAEQGLIKSGLSECMCHELLVDRAEVVGDELRVVYKEKQTAFDAAFEADCEKKSAIFKHLADLARK